MTAVFSGIATGGFALVLAMVVVAMSDDVYERSTFGPITKTVLFVVGMVTLGYGVQACEDHLPKPETQVVCEKPCIVEQ